MSTPVPPELASAPAADAARAGVPAAIGFWHAFRFWLRLGFISFGGPAGQIAVMHAELVERRRWISERRFLHALNYCMLLPGPEAQQLATYVGWLLHRTPGALVAGTLFVLPSLLILIALSWVYVRHGDVPAVAAVLYAIKPAVVAIVVHACWRIGSRALGGAALRVIAVAAFVAIFALGVPFPAIVAAAALAGALGARWRPAAFAPRAPHAGAAAAVHAPAVIDDDTPARVAGRHATLRAGAVGIALWAATLGALALVVGRDGTLAQMGWFFTKAALLTFGGAYAVLPYVYQGAVVEHGWLDALQMLDGLALGETTPGPLIMVVAFVGFVGGHAHAVLGPDAPFLSGAIAALVVSWFTFLPSFVFILAGAPLVEATRGRLGFTAPLTAITAAVVGVIANLALFLAYHVLWPQGFGGEFDATATAIALAAGAALFVFRRGVIEVIVAAAALGAVGALAGL